MSNNKHQFIIECPVCQNKVSVLCNKNITLLDDIEENNYIIKFSIFGTAKHNCNIGE